MTLSDIKAAVCGVFDLTEADLISHSREQKYAHARHIFVGLARDMTDCRLTEIGAALGGRDHTTILNSQRRFEHLCSVNEQFVRRADNARAIAFRSLRDRQAVERLFDDLGERLCAGTASQVTRVNRIASRHLGAWLEVRGTIR